MTVLGLVVVLTLVCPVALSHIVVSSALSFSIAQELSTAPLRTLKPGCSRGRSQRAGSTAWQRPSFAGRHNRHLRLHWCINSPTFYVAPIDVDCRWCFGRGKRLQLCSGGACSLGHSAIVPPNTAKLACSNYSQNTVLLCWGVSSRSLTASPAGGQPPGTIVVVILMTSAPDRITPRPLRPCWVDQVPIRMEPSLEESIRVGRRERGVLRRRCGHTVSSNTTTAPIILGSDLST